MKYVIGQLKTKTGSLTKGQVDRFCDAEGHEYRRRRTLVLEYLEESDCGVEWPEDDDAKERAKSGFRSYLLENIVLLRLGGPSLMPMGQAMRDQCKKVGLVYMGQTEETRICSKYAVRERHRRIRQGFAKIAQNQEQEIWTKTSAIKWALDNASSTNEPGPSETSLMQWCRGQEASFAKEQLRLKRLASTSQ